MWVIIAKQTYKEQTIKRAFLKETTRGHNSFIKEMKELGWGIESHEVDSVMIETLQLQFSIDRK